MPDRPPIVSVNLVTYNQREYIAESIQSVLNQTFADLELVVVDDGSTDGTSEVVRSFNDPRIRAFYQPNQGPSVACNRALAECRGNYVAFMTGDDLSTPDRLELQLNAYKTSGPGLVFAAVDFIDERGQALTGKHFADNLFRGSQQSRSEIYRRFFFEGNFINAVTGFTETRLLREIGPFDPCLFQLQDFHMWVRAVKKYPITILSDRLLRYRIRDNDGNLSARTPGTATRGTNEFYLIMRAFFDDVPNDFFREAFVRELRRPELDAPNLMRCEQAFLLFNSPHPEVRLIGIERFHQLFQNDDIAELLEHVFQFSRRMFVTQLKTIDLAQRFQFCRSKLYLDLGSGFDESNVVEKDIFHTSPFKLRFDLPPQMEIKQLRWDPIENSLCHLQIESANWVDEAGNGHELDPSTFTGNWCHRVDHQFIFETTDPQIILPVDGRVKSVVLEGKWTFESAIDAIRRLVGSTNRLVSVSSFESLQAEHKAEVDMLMAELSEEKFKRRSFGWFAAAAARRLVRRFRQLRGARPIP